MGGAFITHMFLLPLYFQVILGASPIGSGLHNMPLIIAFIVTSIAGATFVTKMGMPMYVMLIGSIIASVGSGLLYTFGANTSEGQWIGYLVLLGLGYGFILQMGVVVGQAASKPEDMAVTTATINCISLCFATYLTFSRTDVRRSTLFGSCSKYFLQHTHRAHRRQCNWCRSTHCYQYWRDRFPK